MAITLSAPAARPFNTCTVLKLEVPVYNEEVLAWVADGTPGSEWDRADAIRNQVLMFMPFMVGSYAIARHRPGKLLCYVPAVVVFTTYWRRFVCARCIYYGRECSTMLGIITARMMPRDESKELDRNAMIVDFAYIGTLSLLPLPQVLKSRRLTVLYLLSAAAGFTAILAGACGRCANEFCPMKDLWKKTLA